MTQQRSTKDTGTPSPRLPEAPREYDQMYMADLLRTLEFFISQTDNQGDCIKNLGISSATFEFQDVKCGDFIDNMRLTSLGVTGSTAELGITFPVV